MMVYDGLRALDYLLTRSEVDPQRVATLGMAITGTGFASPSVTLQCYNIGVDTSNPANLHTVAATVNGSNATTIGA